HESTWRWNRPVGLGAVLLAASAGIEQYQRVRHENRTDLHVVGHAVGDLVHLFAGAARERHRLPARRRRGGITDAGAARLTAPA
ncbi:hypothetical protein V2I01_29985, partial [Micromonospora sp. BRA006-A]|nr:hypothetical protein [Micromonospora sp. BRA006-A]